MTDNKQLTIPGIYLGYRNEQFKNLIQSLLTSILKKLKKGGEYLEYLTSVHSMKEYASAFTSETIDPENNYQFYEQLGDRSGNKFIVDYFYTRFPQLKCTMGVKVVARLIINYGSKKSFAQLAEKLGFWPFISATNDLRHRKQKDLLEDVFEAFLGVTESLINQKTSIGVGYNIIYRFLKSLFDDMDISLKYENLYDAKTRLKELFDMDPVKEALGKLHYKLEKDEEQKITRTIISCIKDGKITTLATAVAPLQSDSEQHASTIALERMRENGWEKKAPLCYSVFMKGCKPIPKIIEPQKETINDLVRWNKSKYQSYYMSTLLCKYCRERNYEMVKKCLKLGADPNIHDTYGLSPMDLLFMNNSIEPKVVKKIYLKLQAAGGVMQNENIKRVYLDKYDNLN